MSSVIPSQAIGIDTHKGKFDLSCMTHTTSEIGFVQPTYSKVFVPKSRVSIQTRTGSRLSPLFVPTMGQIEIRHYHCFVPFSAVWSQFKDFIEQTPYTLPDGTTFIPSVTPSVYLTNMFYSFFNGSGANASNYSAKMASQLACTIYRCASTDKNSVIEPLSSSEIDTLSSGEGLSNLIFGGDLDFVPMFVQSKDGDIYKLSIDYDNTTSSGKPLVTADKVSTLTDTTEIDDKAWQSLAYPSFQACDFCYNSTYVNSGGSTQYAVLCFNFNGALKRLRTIFLGLGYAFNPWDNVKVTIFKLLAYYKAYWKLFCVARQYNFNNTYCFKCIKFLSDHTVTEFAPTYFSSLWQMFLSFLINELCECRYICPADYYSASDITTQRGSTTGVSSAANLSSFMTYPESLTGNPITSTVGVVGNGLGEPLQVVSPAGLVTPAANPLGQQIALRMLRFVNKNSVIGRKVEKLWRAHFGVSPFVSVLEGGVDEVGKSSTPIMIDAIYNQDSNNADMPLGSYAGMGVSTKKGAVSKRFIFDTKEHGMLITLTAVVPKMGYFQGMLHENSDGVNGRFEFYTPEFDAMGWQAVRYNELIADRQFKLDQTGVVKTDLGIFGYMPRYSHLKVSCKNIVNGDISIPSRQESMLPYTLDRFFPQRSFTGLGKSFVVDALPVNEPNSFRAGTQGRTNRIFSDVSPTDDHVIMQVYFDISMNAPMKS